ncbi:hypothetical protein CROQUDRAFT_673461 [Cronartium quercuum f. sp. fusiforme G11]|uniref:O-methyltransferase n=1 Tax=Cronartium quercuum f. sp. fusiforme G11 TaxID=708437 RepID=A0A9P6T825_9BASI|nr:hypothetical protein CROQUDRAFT_673461 [Cronartium quercuum f. sp. fusiforme G11]
MSIPIFQVCHSPASRIAVMVTEARKALKDGSSNSSSDASQSTVDRILSDAEAVATRQDDYLMKSSNLPDPKAPLTKILDEMLAATETTDWAGLYASGQTSYRLTAAMTSNRYEAGIMTFLSGLLQPRRILEVGMFTGTMTLAFAAGKSVERVVALEAEPFLEGWARPYWKRAGEGINEKIDVRVGFAKDSLEKMVQAGEAPFDLIFIDADKPSYPTYFRQIISNKLLSKKGILLIDNTHFAGTAYAPYTLPFLFPAGIDQESVKKSNGFGEVLVDFNAEVCAHPEVEVVMLPVEDGLTMVKWKDA